MRNSRTDLWEYGGVTLVACILVVAAVGFLIWWLWMY